MTDLGNSPFRALGGEAVLTNLVDTFYGYVSEHPDLTHLFPKDLTETARKQKQFLTQFFGGPPLYTRSTGIRCFGPDTCPS